MTSSAARAGIAPVTSGAFVAVVGPSGAGKDTVMAYARERLGSEPRVRFVRRVVTRASDPSLEDHDTLDGAGFAAAEARGAFALSWASHGHRYGVPVEVDGFVGAGGLAVANLSRAALPAMRERYRRSLVVEITAAPDVLAARLRGRGRESTDEIAARLARAAAGRGRGEGRVVIDNSGPIALAGERFLSLLRDELAALSGQS